MIISEESYNTYTSLYQSRLTSELPQALVVDIWRNFEHLGDGLHANRKTMRRAANRIAKAIHRHQHSR